MRLHPKPQQCSKLNTYTHVPKLLHKTSFKHIMSQHTTELPIIKISKTNTGKLRQTIIDAQELYRYLQNAKEPHKTDTTDTTDTNDTTDTTDTTNVLGFIIDDVSTNPTVLLEDCIPKPQLRHDRVDYLYSVTQACFCSCRSRGFTCSRCYLTL